MQTGCTIQELAAELSRQQAAKVDLIVDTRRAAMTVDDDGELGITAQSDGRNFKFGIDKQAHRQIASRLQIPAKYYDRMKTEDPELLATNVNNWFTDQPEERMLRALDDTVRAFLSNRYQRIDHLDLLKRSLPILESLEGDYIVKSSQVTQSRMYIQIVTPMTRAEIKVGDEVEAGFILGNSETGMGSVFVEQLVWRLICLNGMRRGHSLRKHHVGQRQDEGLLGILSDESLRLEDKALTSKLGDVMAHAVTHEALETAIAGMREATERPIEGNVVKAAEVLVQKVGLTDGEGDKMLQHLIAGGDLTQYGAANAVTRLAHDSESYDRAFELEGLGGQVIDLSSNDWQQVAQAA